MGVVKKKSKSRRDIPEPPPPPPPPDDSTATTATTIAESVAESSVADTSVASSIAPATTAPVTTVPDTNNNTSVAESIAPDISKPPPPRAQPLAPDESFAQQRKLGYVSTTGRYADVLYYNKTRSDYMRIGNFEKVKVIDAAWAAKCRQDKLAVRDWPPPRLFCKTYFWTCGHYKYWTDKYFRRFGQIPSFATTVVVTEPGTTIVEETVVTEKRLSKSKEEKRLSKSTEKTVETKPAEATEEVVMDTLLVTSVSKKKSSRKIGKEKSGLVTEKSGIVKEKSGLVKEKSGLVKKKSGRITEEAPERGRRSVDEAAPQKPPDETPTPSEAVPETPLKVNNFSTHRLHVANIPLDTKIEAVQKLFKGGQVDLYPDPAGTQMLATVKYENVKDAHKAFQNNKKAKLGNKPLVVSPKLREE